MTFAVLKNVARRVGAADRATKCFAVYLVVAYLLIVFHYGKDEWFLHTDWSLILQESLRDFFAPIEQHWSTVPVLLHKTYFSLFGARYFPYLATVVGLHIGMVCMVRIIMRRAGVGPWMATIVAAPLALFGPGYMAIVFTMQITQDLSILFGLLHIVLADHDGGIRRRDWLGLLCGAIGIASSGLAPIFVFGVGVSTLVRRGIVKALFHTGPLTAAFVTWFYLTRPTSFAEYDPFRVVEYKVRDHLLFVWEGYYQSTRALGYFAVVAIAMTAVFAAGLCLGLFSKKEGVDRPRLLVPLVLLLCNLVYFALLGYQRSRSGVEYAGYSHHLYTAVCLNLPALGCAADALVHRWKALFPAVAALFIVVIPFNAMDFGSVPQRQMLLATSFSQANRQRLFAIAHSPYASQALNKDLTKLTTDRWYVNGLTLGWTLEQVRRGRIPRPDPVDRGLDDYIQLFYGLSDLGPPPPTVCEKHEGPLDIRPRQGETLTTGSPVVVLNVRGEPENPQMWSFDGTGHIIRFELPALHLRLIPPTGETGFMLCRQ